MDFSINGSEWVVDKNTDRLNRELFGDANEPYKSKRSRRRKRKKTEFDSQQNVLQKQPCKVSLHSDKPTKKLLKIKKDLSYIHNLKKGKRNVDTIISKNALNYVSKFKHHISKRKDGYNHKCQKLDNPTTDSSELLMENSSKLDCDNRLKTKRTRREKNLHKENSKNNIATLFTKQKCDVENKDLLTVRKLHINSSNYNQYTKDNVMQKKQKKRKKTINSIQNNPQSNISLNSQSSLPRLQNSNSLCATLQISKLKDILKSAQFSHTTNIKLGAVKKRNKGILVLEKGKRNEYSDIIRQKATDKLKSARFRFINEKMYTVTGKESMHLFKLDPDAFDIYHDGFQAQVDRWPLNPVDIIINDINKKPKTLTIADFGCGSAKIAQAFPDRKVHSFDLLSTNSYVTACDMANVPLARESTDIVIFCLALMGTNLNDYLCEAHRVLKMGGQLKIAEVTSRMENAETFINDLMKFGFTLSAKNVSHKMFIFLDFTKTGKFDRIKLPIVELKPCLYKKR